MKSLIISLSLLIVALFFFNACSTPKSGEKMAEYEITVTQDGQEIGKIGIDLFRDKAPKHCANFDSLVTNKFYDGCAFHRVIPGFMIQGGDPNSKDQPKNTWGMGAPGQKKIPAEFNDIPHTKGILSAARTPDPNSATSQFFIMHGSAPHLDGQYTVYGKVAYGIEVVDAICNLPLEMDPGGNAKSSPVKKVEMTIVKK